MRRSKPAKLNINLIVPLLWTALPWAGNPFRLELVVKAASSQTEFLESNSSGGLTDLEATGHPCDLPIICRAASGKQRIIFFLEPRCWHQEICGELIAPTLDLNLPVLIADTAHSEQKVRILVPKREHSGGMIVVAVRSYQSITAAV
jgi:hypothetical protein